MQIRGYFNLRLLGSAGAVLEDVGLVWQNCRTFNAEGSDIHAMADEAEAHFVQLWAKKELPFASADLPKSSSEPRKHAFLQPPAGTFLMCTYTYALCHVLYAMSLPGCVRLHHLSCATVGAVDRADQVRLHEISMQFSPAVCNIPAASMGQSHRLANLGSRAP